MTLYETPGVIKRFSRTPWKFQKTFRTPLQNLRFFVTSAIAAIKSIRRGCVSIDEVVFDPTHWIALQHKYLLPVRYRREWSLEAVGSEEAAELLEAALSDWMDFIFVPEPKHYVIYVDHDKYTTFFANTKSNLNRVANPLLEKGFASVPGYERIL
jgi:hypothetical protein